jgi:4-hydroxy-tetrahydrodipicolinate reductase
MEIKVLQIGLGPLGIKTAKYIDERPNIRTVAAVDKNPNIIGRNLSAHCNLSNSDVTISESVKEAIEGKEIDVVVLTTVSDMIRITPQIEEITSFGLPVVTTCEELSFPFITSPDLAERIDQSAKSNNVSVVATGVNPGFLMDALPINLTAVCQKVNSVTIKRFQNAEFRRIPFQKKIGAGASLAEFEQRKREGSLRHVGLTESMHMIAKRMGWKLDSTEDKILPIIAQSNIKTKDLEIVKGFVAGVRQVGTAISNGKILIQLEFQAAVGEPESYDEIIIDGTPNVRSKIEGGVNGDIATCAIVLNTIPGLLASQPGLRTVADLPVCSYFE